jgi:soluble lytic murein transglycosylase
LPFADAGGTDGVVKRWWIWALLGLLILDVGVVRWWLNRRRDSSHDRIILQAAHRYSVDPALIKAVVWRESQFDPAARGRAGEKGLMQVGEAAAYEWVEAEQIRLFHPAQLFDPKQNTLAGTWYLSKLLARYPETDNPIPYALADYNAGRKHVLRWNQGAAATNSSAFIEQIDFPTTKNYIMTVLERYDHYRRRISKNGQ